MLHGFYREHLDKDRIDALLASLGLDREVRAESLTADQFIALAVALRAALPTEALPAPTGPGADDGEGDEEGPDASPIAEGGES